MQAFGDKEGGFLRDHQIKDLVTFIKNLDDALLEEMAEEKVTEPEPASTPTPTPTPLSTATIQPTPDEAVVAEGKALFTAKTCAACHGANAEGTAIAPSLSGQTGSNITKRVREGVGGMPSFSTDRLGDEELVKIVKYLEGL